MADLKERNIVMVSKDSDGATIIDYPLTIPEQIEGLEAFIKKYGGKTATTLDGYGITDAHITNGTITLGNNSITPITNLDNVAKISVANTWTAQQIFQQARLAYERYFSPKLGGTSIMPQTSVIHCIATGEVTLNLNHFSTTLEDGDSTVFTAYIESFADYPLTITNAGTIKYIGSASDLAITSAGLLLNILMMKDEDGNVTSIVQASKLEGAS